MQDYLLDNTLLRTRSCIDSRRKKPQRRLAHTPFLCKNPDYDRRIAPLKNQYQNDWPAASQSRFSLKFYSEFRVFNLILCFRACDAAHSSR